MEVTGNGSDIEIGELNEEGRSSSLDAEEGEIISPAYVALPELTKLNIFFAFVGLILGIVDTGSDIVSAVFSFLDNDTLTGIFTVIVIYLSGSVASLVWTNISIFGLWESRFERRQFFEINTEKDEPVEISSSRWTGFFHYVESCAIACAIVVFILAIIGFAIVCIPLFIPFILLINFGLQILYYNQLGEIDPKKRNATVKELRDTIDKTTRIDIVKGFCEDAPQTLLQMYVLTTKFETFVVEKISTRFWITLLTVVSSVVGLGLAVAGRWCAILQPYPAMTVYPMSMTLVLYVEAISLLLIRTMLICCATTIVRVLAGSGLAATGIMIGILGIPRLNLLLIYMLSTWSSIQHDKARHVWRVSIRLISSILFYPVIHYQWILIYMECESVVLGFLCVFLYYGDFDVQKKIAFVNAIPPWLATLLLWLAVLIFIFNNGIRWVRVIYLLRVNKMDYEKSMDILFQHLQRITDILDDWEIKGKNTQKTYRRSFTENNVFFLRELNTKLTGVLDYFHANFPKKKENSICICHYRTLVNAMLTEELNRRAELKKTLTKGYKLAEKNSKYKLKNGLLYSELVNFVIMRLLMTAEMISGKSKALTEYEGHLGAILTVWEDLYNCLPEQFLAKCPEFTFTSYSSLLDEDKAKSMFSVPIQGGTDEVECPIKLRGCDLCQITSGIG